MFGWGWFIIVWLLIFGESLKFASCRARLVVNGYRITSGRYSLSSSPRHRWNAVVPFLAAPDKTLLKAVSLKADRTVWTTTARTTGRRSIVVLLVLLLGTFPGRIRRLHNNRPSRGDWCQYFRAVRGTKLTPSYFWCYFQFHLISHYLLHYDCFIFPLPDLILYSWTIHDVYAVYFLWCIFWFYYSEIWDFIWC